MTKKVTKRDAMKVLAAVKRQFKPWLGRGVEGPVLRMDFDWLGNGAHPAIVWEGGPYDWSQYAVHGGVEEEFGFTIPAVEIPAAVFTEPDTGWALALWPA